MQTVNSIEWHEHCLKAQEDSHLRKQRALQLREDEVRRSYSDLCFYRSQIREAIARGKTSFDCDKFLKFVEKSA